MLAIWVTRSNLTRIVGPGMAGIIIAESSVSMLFLLNALSFFDGSLPLGYLLMGWLSGLCGASIALLIGALLSLMVTGAGWMWRKPAEKDGAEPAGM